MATTVEFYIYQKNPCGIQAGIYASLLWTASKQKKFNIELNGGFCIREFEENVVFCIVYIFGKIQPFIHHSDNHFWHILYMLLWKDLMFPNNDDRSHTPNNCGNWFEFLEYFDIHSRSIKEETTHLKECGYRQKVDRVITLAILLAIGHWPVGDFSRLFCPLGSLLTQSKATAIMCKQKRMQKYNPLDQRLL